MVIGALRVALRLPESFSLKDKRMLLRPIIERVRSQYHVAVAEVGEEDAWQMAIIGVACVSNSSAHANEMLSKVADFISHGRWGAEVVDVQTDIIHWE